MVKSVIQSVEAFHLVFLKLMEAKVNRACYVVKGGVNMRAWFGSMRYSEDLDLDAIDIGQQSLTEKIDKLLEAAPFETLLRNQGLKILGVSKPKQTQTTQRWKFQVLATASQIPLHTKIEFSRRDSTDAYELEPVRGEVLRPYGIPAPTVNHYTAPSAIRQKIGALAGRMQTQARDIWDLDHLFRTARADVASLPPREILVDAASRVTDPVFDDFKSQVSRSLNPITWTFTGLETRGMPCRGSSWRSCWNWRTCWRPGRERGGRVR